MADQITMIAAKGENVSATGDEVEVLDRREKFIKWYNEHDDGLYSQGIIGAEEIFEWIDRNRNALKDLLFTA